MDELQKISKLICAWLVVLPKDSEVGELQIRLVHLAIIGVEQVNQEGVYFLSAIILYSHEPDRLAEFYRTVVGVPLVADNHSDGGPAHYECDLGDVHFAIFHDEEKLLLTSERNRKVGLAFAVFSVDHVLEKLAAHKLTPLYPPVNRGFALMTAINDPDGNLIELTQLSDSWLSHLEKRTIEERDVVEHLKAMRNRPQ